MTSKNLKKPDKYNMQRKKKKKRQHQKKSLTNNPTVKNHQKHIIYTRHPTIEGDNPQLREETPPSKRAKKSLSKRQ